MPRGKHRSRARLESASPTLRERRLGVLSCPTCGHESPVEGDWVEVPADEGVDLGSATLGERSVEMRCPVCSEHLTTLRRE